MFIFAETEEQKEKIIFVLLIYVLLKGMIFIFIPWGFLFRMEENVENFCFLRFSGICESFSMAKVGGGEKTINYEISC